MQPRIEHTPAKKLIGQHLSMSLIDNKTAELWRNFAPKMRAVPNRVGQDAFSLQVYPPLYHRNFSPSTSFEKWALVEVSSFEIIPEDMEAFELPGGMYAVFDYKGSSADTSIFQYIFMNWLPNSAYELDDRPHFEVLGEKYKNNDPESEEEIWIPVRNRAGASD